MSTFAIGEYASATHHGSAGAHIGHGGREVQQARIMSSDANFNAARPLVYQSVNANLKGYDVMGLLVAVL